MSQPPNRKERWVVLDDIPGIAMRDELIVVDHRGILVGRWLPMSKYPALMESRHLLRLPGALTANRKQSPDPLRVLNIMRGKLRCQSHIHLQ